MKLDLEGQRYGFLTVITEAPHQGKRRRWHCLCELCGSTHTAQQSSLRGGKTKSCGCLPKAKSSVCNTSHGGVGTKLYMSWRDMKSRCNNSSHMAYANYGGRDIKVCSEWESFATFRDWALSSGYEDGLTIERKNNDAGYSPSNCLWVTMREQNRNKRGVKLTTRSVGFIKRYLRDTSMTHTEIGKLFSVSKSTVRNIKAGNVWADIQPIGA